MLFLDGSPIRRCRKLFKTLPVTFLGTFWYWGDPDTCSCRVSRETSQDLLHPAVKWLWRPGLVRLAFSSEGLCLFGTTRILLHLCAYSRSAGFWWERPWVPVFSAVPYFLAFVHTLWSLLCQAWFENGAVVRSVKPFTKSHLCQEAISTPSSPCCWGPVQQRLLPPMGVIPSGNPSSLTLYQ